MSRRGIVPIIIGLLMIPLLGGFIDGVQNTEPDNPILIAETEDGNAIGNPGFETGAFAPWDNVEGTIDNQIVNTTQYNGNYSLYLDSHLSSAPYEPVEQWLAENVSLSEDLRISAAIYPEKVGDTCGQAGVSELYISFYNRETDSTGSIYYEWSGYTYPGGFLGSNITHVRYLLFDWTPNSWNILNRSVYEDYVAFWGTPSDPSQIEFFRVKILAHTSNGDPGDFYIDDMFLGFYSTEHASTTTTTSSIEPTTTIPEFSTSLWHHDCSNTTGWIFDPNPPQPVITLKEGITIQSNGNQLYSSYIELNNETQETHYGSTFFYQLEHPIKHEGLYFEINVDHLGADDVMGMLTVRLHDEHMNASFFLGSVDGWYSSYYSINQGYVFSTGEYVIRSHESYTDGSWSGNLQVWHDIETGKVMSQDYSGTYELVSGEAFELNREVHYVSVTYYAKGSFYYESELLDDIWISGTPISETSTTTTSPQTTTDTTIITSASSEITSSFPTTSSTTETNTTTGGGYTLISVVYVIITAGSTVIIIIFIVLIIKSRE